jgi:hypothetical protein
MGIFTYFSSPAKPETPSESPELAVEVKEPVDPAVEPAGRSSNSSDSVASSESAAPSSIAPLPTAETTKPGVLKKLFSASSPNVSNVDSDGAAAKKRRFSFKPSAPVSQEDHKPVLSSVQEHEKKSKAKIAFSQRFAKPLTSNSDKRAKESALVVRTLILGPPSTISPKVTRAVAKPQLSKVKAQLMQPKAANKVIAELRLLPPTSSRGASDTSASTGPINAVCLEHADEEEHNLYFAQLAGNKDPESPTSFANISSTPLDKLTDMFNNMNIISLVTATDLGIGQPGDGPGLLSGAVPTAETVINGIQQITPQLLALGFATGKAVLPDHTGTS